MDLCYIFDIVTYICNGLTINAINTHRTAVLDAGATPCLAASTAYIDELIERYIEMGVLRSTPLTNDEIRFGHSRLIERVSRDELVCEAIITFNNYDN